MDRAIIHLNVADFAVAVERGVDCRLKSRPVIIAPAGAVRAAVYDMSEEAYAAGVRKGMTLRSAVRRCRDATVLPPHPDRYERAMQALIRRTRPYSPLIEPGDGDGHLFADVTGTGRLFGPPVDVAWRLRKQVRRDLGLNPIWALAPNKLVAKVATRLVKPSGEYIVAPGEEAALLAPLPIHLIPGIERRDLLRLRAFNLRQASQVAALSWEHLEIPFGKRTGFIYEAVRGIDSSPVLPLGQKPPQACAAHEFGDAPPPVAVLERALYRLVERVGRDLRGRRLAARRITIALDYADGLRHARRARLQPASANDLILFRCARPTLQQAWSRRVRIRHLRLTCDRLIFPPAQQSLFAADRQHNRRQTAMVAAMDTIRNRFGPNAIRMGLTLAAG